MLVPLWLWIRRLRQRGRAILALRGEVVDDLVDLIFRHEGAVVSGMPRLPATLTAAATSLLLLLPLLCFGVCGWDLPGGSRWIARRRQVGIPRVSIQLFGELQNLLPQGNELSLELLNATVAFGDQGVPCGDFRLENRYAGQCVQRRT